MERLADELDRTRPPGTDRLDEDTTMYEEMLLMCAALAGQRDGLLNTSVAVGKRALALQRDGRLVLDDEPVENVLRGLACEVEDELVQLAEDIADGKPEAAATGATGGASTADRAAGVQALRTMLTSHASCLREDVVGIVFCAALSAQLLGSSLPLDDTDPLRADARVQATEVPRERRLLRAADRIVDCVRDRRGGD